MSSRNSKMGIVVPVRARYREVTLGAGVPPQPHGLFVSLSGGHVSGCPLMCRLLGNGAGGVYVGRRTGLVYSALRDRSLNELRTNFPSRSLCLPLLSASLRTRSF